MEAVTIRADEIRVGDRFAIPETGRPGVLVTDANLPPWDAVEVWTESDPMGMPVNLRRGDRVEVWRLTPEEWEDSHDGRCPGCGEDSLTWEPGDGGGGWVPDCDCREVPA